MGLFEFYSMPFGPKNIGSVYARFVDMLLQRIRSQNVVLYIDDVLIFTKDLEHHLTELRSVFELHRLAGIKLRPTKQSFSQNLLSIWDLMYHKKGLV